MAVLSPDGQAVRLFDALTGAWVQDLPMPGRRVLGLYAATHGHRLVTVELAARRPDPAEGGGPGSDPPSPRRGEGRPPGMGGPPDRFEVNLWDPARPDRPLASLGAWEPDANGGIVFPLVAVSPDGRVVATARARGTAVELWAGEGGEALGAPIDTQVEVTALALGTDDQLATAGSGEIRLWDLDTRAPLSTITPNQSSVRLLRFNPRGSLLAVVGWLGRDVELWDPAAHAVVAVLPTTEPVDDVSFSPDGRTLVAAGRGATTPAWDVVEPAARTRLGGFDALTRSMAFRSDGLLALGTYAGSVRFWQAGRGVQSGGAAPVVGAGGATATPPSPNATKERAAATGVESEPASLAFDDQGRLVTLERGALRVWNNPPRCSAGGLVRLPGSGALSRFTAVLAGSSDGRFMALTVPPSSSPPPRAGRPSGDGPPPREGRPPDFNRGTQVFLWRSDEQGGLTAITPPADVDRDRDRGRFGGSGAWRTLCVAPGGGRVYLVDFSGDLDVWDLDGGTAVEVRWRDLPEDVMSLALSPDGSRLALGGRSGGVTLLDTETGAALGQFDPTPGESDGSIGSLAFSPDGRSLAVGTQQGAVVLRSVDAPEAAGLRLPGHRGYVSSLAFSPEGRHLATAGSDRVVDVWDLSLLRDEFERLGLGQ